MESGRVLQNATVYIGQRQHYSQSFPDICKINMVLKVIRLNEMSPVLQSQCVECASN